VGMKRRSRTSSNGSYVWLSLVVLVSASLALGCAKNDVASSQPTTTPSPSGQQLPIEAVAIIGTQRFDLEVARTTGQQRLGLMFRDPLPEARGMLFPFDPPRPANFWMYNVTFPLDMVFMLEGEVVHIEESVPGCSEQPCPSYGPPQTTLVDSVLELNGGTTNAIGLSVGDSIEVKFSDAEVAGDNS
ncbi:MAG: DUF192 domain-containing protein, partial [Cyanobacteria bacterium P01_E01_bin.34]